MPFAAVNGARLYYERRGDGEPLLFISGFAISAAVFTPVLDTYTERFDCIVYDNRSSGRSSTPRRPISIPELAADAAGLLERLGVESAHVYGVSMGGMIAQELAIRFPERVRGLILGCTTPGGPRAFRPSLAEVGALAARALGTARGAGRPGLGALLFSPEFRSQHPERVRELLRGFGAHRSGGLGVAAHFWASVYHDTVSRLGRIRAPTLVLHGGRDALSPLENSRLLARRIPDAELAIVPGAGHAYALERPEESFALLTEWLDRRGPIPAGRPRGRWATRTEPLTRPFGLPIGAARTGVSLAALAAGRVRPRAARTSSAREEQRHVAPDPRAG